MSKEGKIYGLIGKNISYSFSRSYFTDKFSRLKLDHLSYVNFDLNEIGEFASTVLPRLDEIGGMNVTIPYKLEIMDLLDEIDPEAAEIGAVNTIKILEGSRMKGFNTDVFGFESSLRAAMRGDEESALILGTGGASRAVAFVFDKMGISFRYVSRSPKGKRQISYEQLEAAELSRTRIIVNCTPLGTFPDVERKPELPYEALNESHLLYDLIYNPERTAFLLEGLKRGSKVVNGREMLERQADRSWEIWNS